MSALTSLRVLVVDDEPGMRRTLSRVLKARGYQVETADDGLSDVDAAAEFRPDCILMDLRMARHEGIEAFRRIKPVCPNAFVIFMTAYSSGELTGQAVGVGAVEVLAKPLELEHLSELIERTARKRAVLVIDDDPAFCASLERILASHAFDVRTATSVEEAMAAFEQRPRGIVILDVCLGNVSGVSLIGDLRSRNPDVCVVLVSGREDVYELMQSAVGDGAASCLTKPLDLNLLLQTIGTTA
jgi:DNA-binding NtrC family response regulator